MNDALGRDSDAIRYIVLRKLASGLRHTLMGELQSIQFLAELSARLLGSGGDESRARECVNRIPAAANDAIATGQSVIEWLRPDESAITTLGEAVEQCVKLAGDNWRMRATVATVDMPESAGAAGVSKAAARELVITALLALTDQHAGPLDILVTARRKGEHVELHLRARSSDRVALFRPSIVHRSLALSDVNALATEHRVACECESASVKFRFDLAARTPEAT